MTFNLYALKEGLLPPDLLRRVLDPKESLPGTLAEDYVLWLKINRTKKRGNYPTPSLPSLVIVRNGLRQKKENFVSSSNLVLSFRPMASFITSQ